MTIANAASSSSRVNYIFVDFENVRQINLSVIGGKTVHFTLLLGPKDKKLDVTIVEKLWEHAASVQLVRLTSAGKNALDFTLAYYVGRAVLANPAGCFHIMSKDKGYDSLVEHLCGRNIHAQRHDDFSTLNFSVPASCPPVSAKPPTATSPAVTTKLKAQLKPKPQPRILDERAAQVLEHLRKPSATRPKKRDKLISFLVAHLGHKISEAEALAVVENLRQAGHIALDGKGTVTYQVLTK